MEAKKIKRESLKWLQDQIALDPKRIGNWEALLNAYLPGSIESTGVFIPDVEFAAMGSDAKHDAASAIHLYHLLPPTLLGKLCFDIGFWVWLSLESTSASEYIRRRWSEESSFSVRWLGKTRPHRQGVYRLWIGAHTVTGDSTAIDGEKYVKDLFFKQDIFEQCIGHGPFRETYLARAFVSTCKGKNLKTSDVVLLGKRLDDVIGSRYLLGLDSETLGREVDQIATDMLRASNVPPPPPMAAKKIKLK